MVFDPHDGDVGAGITFIVSHTVKESSGARCQLISPRVELGTLVQTSMRSQTGTLPGTNEDYVCIFIKDYQQWLPAELFGPVIPLARAGSA